MKINEFKKIKKLSYKEYCQYLKKKYGESKYNYFTQNFSPVRKCKRTTEGLVVHHIYENEAILLGNKEYAKKNPYEYQLAKNLVYCDLLEHLWLHILICKESSLKKDIERKQWTGRGGITNFLIPELNDYFFCEWKTMEEWRKKLHEKISLDKETYIAIVDELKISKILNKYPDYCPEWYYGSLNSRFPGKSWSDQNKKAYLKFINESRKKDKEFDQWVKNKKSKPILTNIPSIKLNENDELNLMYIFTAVECNFEGCLKYIKRLKRKSLEDVETKKQTKEELKIY